MSICTVLCLTLLFMKLLVCLCTCRDTFIELRQSAEERHVMRPITTSQQSEVQLDLNAAHLSSSQIQYQSAMSLALKWRPV